MRFTLHEIKKETFKFLGDYLGIRAEQLTSKSPDNGNPLMRTPDFYNTRLNGTRRKKLTTTCYPE
jgi:hypothetical protein